MVSIMFFTANDIISRAIQFFEGSKVSHTAIGLMKDGHQMCLSAVWGGVQLIPREQAMKSQILFAEYKILPYLGNEIKLAEKKVGEPYDVLGLFGYIPVLLARHFGIGIHNPLASKSAVVCSEFVVELDVERRIPEFIGLDPSTIDPADLYNICVSGKSFEKIGSV